MEKINIEFRNSSTGSYSPWHLEIADELGVGLIGTSDVKSFVRIRDDIYTGYNMNKLYKYLTTLEEMNDNGDISDEDVLKEIDDIVNNRNNDFTLKKCIPLDEFREILIKQKTKDGKRRID